MVWRRRYIWDPFEELRRMDELVDRAFGETGPDYFGRRALPGATGEELAETAAPYVNIKEKGVIKSSTGLYRCPRRWTRIKWMQASRMAYSR